MADTSIKGAIWTAVIAGTASSIGYGFAYFKDIELERESRKHTLLLELLREDPRESSRNLLWAYSAGILELSKQTVAALQEDPFSAPTKASDKNDAGVFNETVPESDVAALVRDLDANEQPARLRALRVLIESHLSSEQAVRAATVLITQPYLDVLTANGRVNVLSYLGRVNWNAIPEDLRNTVLRACEQLLERAEVGEVAAGRTTRSHIDRIRAAIGSVEQ
jgi:hypothetical protein